MSGNKAARVGDKVSKGVIVSGSATVLIGDAGEGCADKPTGCTPAVGGPVNPILGVKLLPAETDFALAAPSPFAFARSYLSSDARIGALGQGWSIPGEGLGLETSSDATVLIDAQGRRITFGPLAPGEARFSPSERLWIRRGGPIIPQTDALEPWSGRWVAIPQADQHDAHNTFVLAGGEYYQFARQADASLRLIAQFDRNGYRTGFEWDVDDTGAGASGALMLVRVRDSAGRQYHLSYQRVSPIAPHDTGLRLAGVYIAANTHTNERGGDGRDWLVRYEYGCGDLIGVIDRGGARVRSFEWQAHRMVAHAQPGGIEVRYEWDASGKVIRQIEAGGLTRDYTYAPGHTTVTDSLGRSEIYHFEGEGPDTRWTAHTRADGSRIEYQYDGFGRRIASIDALGRITRSPLDGEGRPIGHTLPDGSRWRYQLDEAGEPIRIDAPEQQSWTIARDARANPITVTAPDGGITTYAYGNPRLPDRPTAITDAQGGARTLEWTALGQLAAHTDCSGRRTEYRYDGEGHLIAERNALGQTTSHQYDRLGRLIQRTAPDGTTTGYRYDTLGRLIGIERPEGTREQLSWDRFGRLTGFMNAAGLTQRYRHDAAGRLVELHNENEAISRFSYDVMDRLVRETGFDARTQEYAYNRAGELIGRTEASLPQAPETRYEHDAMGRLIARHLPATEHAPASTETYQWRADGQLAVCANAHAQVRLAYDRGARPIHETQTHHDAWHYSAAHRHTALGAPASSTLGHAPAIAWLTYGAGHLHGVRIGDLALDIERDALHRETARRLTPEQANAPSLIEHRHYTALGQLAEQRLEPAVGAVLTEAYRYDKLGRLRARGDAARPEHAIAYTYDDANRLTGSRHGNHARTYHFDAAGNRVAAPPAPGRRPTEAEWAAIVRERLHDPSFNPLEELGLDAQGAQRWPDNRITQLDGVTSTYDGAGNLIERTDPDGTRLELGYDGAHRLVSLTRTGPDATTTRATYAYDALSRRIAKTVTGPDGIAVTARYGWDGERLVCEDDGQTVTTIVHEPASFVPLLKIEQPSDTLESEEQQEEQALLAHAAELLAAHGMTLPEELQPESAQTRISLYHTDHLGTPLRLIDAEGKTLWHAEPDDWGAVRNQHGIRQPIRYQGQWEDEESGLYYNRYRYYDPAMGRYITQDPIGLAGGMNGYGYPGNPVTWIDPMGLDTYAVNRDLAAFGDSARSRSNPITHTFAAITDKNGTVVSTYSWGNDANLNGWNVNQPIDMKSAQEAITKGLAEKVGDASLDPYVKSAYDNLNKNENEHMNGIVYFNCKTETNKLIKAAEQIKRNHEQPPMLVGPVSIESVFGGLR